MLKIVALRRDETQQLTDITQHDIAALTATFGPARQLLLRCLLQEQGKHFAEEQEDDDDEEEDEEDEEEDGAR